MKSSFGYILILLPITSNACSAPRLGSSEAPNKEDIENYGGRRYKVAVKVEGNGGKYTVEICLDISMLKKICMCKLPISA